MTGTARGSTRGRWSWPGITRDTPDPRDGRIERNRRRRAVRHAARGCDELVVTAVAPVDTDEDYAAGLRIAQTYLHSLGITAWQDADIVRIDDSYRTLGHVRARGGERRAHRSGDRGAVVEPSSRPRADRAIRRRARAGHRRTLRADQREDHAGRRRRELHRGHADALPRRERRADRQRRHLVRRSRTAEGRRDAAGRARVPDALPRAGRSCGARGPGRDRGRADRERSERQPPPSGAHPDRASRRHPAVPSAGRGRERPAALGGARGPDGQPDDPVHRPRARVVAVPVRQPGAGRRRAGVRQRLERLEPEPAAGDDDRRRTPSARRARSRSSARRSARSSSPRNGSTWPPRSERSPWAPRT